jgi:hypothetical protein
MSEETLQVVINGFNVLSKMMLIIYISIRWKWVFVLIIHLCVIQKRTLSPHVLSVLEFNLFAALLINVMV